MIRYGDHFLKRMLSALSIERGIATIVKYQRSMRETRAGKPHHSKRDTGVPAAQMIGSCLTSTSSASGGPPS